MSVLAPPPAPMPLRGVPLVRRRPAGADGAAPAEVAVVLGTRSEAVALAPVVRALRRDGRFAPLVVSTGQQRGVLDQVLRPLGIRPDVDLGPTGAAGVERLGDLLAARRPTAVLVHGDSASAFGAAVAACSEGIDVGHLGAGWHRPAEEAVEGAGAGEEGSAPARALPEEANRRLIAPLARWHLAPTAQAAETLVAEGIDPAGVVVAGTTEVDTVLWAASLHRGTSAFGAPRPVRSRRVLACLRLAGADRTEVARVATVVRRLADGGWDVVLPAHPDGTPESLLAEISVADRTAGEGTLRLVPPMEYLDFVATMRDANVVLTDSTAVALEAPALGTPVAGVRGIADPDGLVAACQELVHRREIAAAGPTECVEGLATQRVVEVLVRSLVRDRRGV